jgi:hypothetical protein
MNPPDREQVIAAIKKAAEDSGNRYLTIKEFEQISGMEIRYVQKYFGNWRDACQELGLVYSPPNLALDPNELLADWGTITREHGKAPSKTYYKFHGNFSIDALRTNFGPWYYMPDAFRRFAQDKPQWEDVVALLPPPGDWQWSRRKRTKPLPGKAPSRSAPGKLPDRPTYGDPIEFRGLRHSPVNEQGVVFLFGMIASELGYLVESVQTGFPDCEAKRQISPGKWQRLRIEFEYESKGFINHGHPIDGCDLIVCWIHNWEDCPLEVVELSKQVRPEGIRDHAKT